MLLTRVEKSVQDSPVNKQFRLQQSVKKAMLTVFWDMKRLISIDFLEKSATVNCVFYCQLCRQNLSYLLNDALMYRVQLLLVAEGRVLDYPNRTFAQGNVLLFYNYIFH